MNAMKYASIMKTQAVNVTSFLIHCTKVAGVWLNIKIYKTKYTVHVKSTGYILKFTWNESRCSLQMRNPC